MMMMMILIDTILYVFGASAAWICYLLMSSLQYICQNKNSNKNRACSGVFALYVNSVPFQQQIRLFWPQTCQM